WICTCFRNESPHLSSELIRQAVTATRWFWPDPPEDGMVTFVNPARAIPTRHRLRAWSGQRTCREGRIAQFLAFAGCNGDQPAGAHADRLATRVASTWECSAW